MKDILIDDIRTRGAMSVARYMELCLGHAQCGYYMRQDPLGAQGDFTTAPEISQMFGEIIGAWAADQWMQLGAPSSFYLLELGPGRGTLMADMLRVLTRVDGFMQGVQVCLVEMSPVLKEKQRHALHGYPVTWFETIEDVQVDAPLIVVANEFFDALPIQQFLYTKNAWRERVITQQGEGAFSWGLAPACDVLPGALHERYSDPEEGDVLEHSIAVQSVFGTLSERMAAHSGAGLVVDYGYCDYILGDSFQALYEHRYVDALEGPGLADLTAHVNFAMLRDLAVQNGLHTSDAMTQGAFLKACGIDLRAQALKKSANTEQAHAIDAALRRLTDCKEMGALFKVIEFSKGIVR